MSNEAQLVGTEEKDNQKLDGVINLLEGLTNELKDKRDYEARDINKPIEIDTYKYTRLEIKNIDKEYKKHNVKFVSNIILSSAVALGLGVMAFNNPDAITSMDLGSMTESITGFINSIPLYRNLDLSFIKEFTEKLTPGLLVTSSIGLGIVNRITSSIKEKKRIDKEKQVLEEKAKFFIEEHPELEEDIMSLLGKTEEKQK